MTFALLVVGDLLATWEETGAERTPANEHNSISADEEVRVRVASRKAKHQARYESEMLSHDSLFWGNARICRDETGLVVAQLGIRLILKFG